MPESLAADLDAECSACLMGARRLAELFDRYGRRGRSQACFDAILERPRRHVPARDPLPKIPDGTYVWEDYAEHDGVDPPRLHTQRITLTKHASAAGRRPDAVIDFTGTGPQAKGPINHCGDYAGRELPGQVAGADPAQPGRHRRSGWPSSTSTRASSR